MFFELVTPFVHNADGRQGGGIPERTESPAQHVLGKIADNVDILGPRCADPHSPKAVRASMGAVFAVQLARVRDVSELPGERVALLPDAEQALRADHASAGGAVTLLVGAERDGLPASVVGACERSARIPIASHSLNAAMAATVALYELTSSRVRP